MCYFFIFLFFSFLFLLDRITLDPPPLSSYLLPSLTKFSSFVSVGSGDDQWADQFGHRRAGGSVVDFGQKQGQVSSRGCRGGSALMDSIWQKMKGLVRMGGRAQVLQWLVEISPVMASGFVGCWELQWRAVCGRSNPVVLLWIWSGLAPARFVLLGWVSRDEGLDGVASVACWFRTVERKGIFLTVSLVCPNLSSSFSDFFW